MTSTSEHVRPTRPTGDRGSVLVVTILFFVIAMLLVMGVSAASVAFVAQRDLAAMCDSAAIAAATAVDMDDVYTSGAGAVLAVDEQSARRVVAEYLAGAYGGDPAGVRASVATEGPVVAVECHSTARIPFGSAFGYPEGLPRTAVSKARMPAGP